MDPRGFTYGKGDGTGEDYAKDSGESRVPNLKILILLSRSITLKNYF